MSRARQLETKTTVQPHVNISCRTGEIFQVDAEKLGRIPYFKAAFQWRKEQRNFSFPDFQADTLRHFCRRVEAGLAAAAFSAPVGLESAPLDSKYWSQLSACSLVQLWDLADFIGDDDLKSSLNDAAQHIPFPAAVLQDIWCETRVNPPFRSQALTQWASLLRENDEYPQLQVNSPFHRDFLSHLARESIIPSFPKFPLEEVAARWAHASLQPSLRTWVLKYMLWAYTYGEQRFEYIKQCELYYDFIAFRDSHSNLDEVDLRPYPEFPAEQTDPSWYGFRLEYFAWRMKFRDLYPDTCLGCSGHRDLAKLLADRVPENVLLATTALGVGRR